MFRELYYWVYTIYVNRKGKRFKGEEADYAYWVITGLLLLNWVALSLIFDWLLIIICHFSFVDFLFSGRGKSPISFLFAIIIMSPVLLYTYFQLYRKRKGIIQQYKNKKMSQFRQDWGKLFFWLYVIFSIVSVLWIAVLLRDMGSEMGI